MPPEHGDDHRETPGIDAGANTARHCEIGRRYERLHFEQERARALEHAADRGSDLTGARRPEELRRIGHADEPGGGHLEDAELVRRAEAILGRAEDAVLVVAIALELEHAVDEMLEDTRSGDRAVLRHVTDQDRRHARLLRDAEKPPGGLANLRDGSRSRAERGGVERLHRIDDAYVGTLRFERRADRVELGLGEDVDRLGAAEPRGAERDLRCGLLARDEECATAATRDRPERGEQERRLSDAGLTADEHQRSGNEPTPQDPVELRDSGRDAIRILDAHRPDGDGLQGACRDTFRRRAMQLLDQAPEDTAARALAEPAA